MCRKLEFACWIHQTCPSQVYREGNGLYMNTLMTFFHSRYEDYPKSNHSAYDKNDHYILLNFRISFLFNCPTGVSFFIPFKKIILKIGFGKHRKLALFVTFQYFNKGMTQCRMLFLYMDHTIASCLFILFTRWVAERIYTFHVDLRTMFLNLIVLLACLLPHFLMR